MIGRQLEEMNTVVAISTNSHIRRLCPRTDNVCWIRPFRRSKRIHQSIVTSAISFLIGHPDVNHGRIDGTVPECSLHFRQIHVSAHHVRGECVL
jgi:hypothetical protein